MRLPGSVYKGGRGIDCQGLACRGGDNFSGRIVQVFCGEDVDITFGQNSPSLFDFRAFKPDDKWNIEANGLVRFE